MTGGIVTDALELLDESGSLGAVSTYTASFSPVLDPDVNFSKIIVEVSGSLVGTPNVFCRLNGDSGAVNYVMTYLRTTGAVPSTVAVNSVNSGFIVGDSTILTPAARDLTATLWFQASRGNISDMLNYHIMSTGATVGNIYGAGQFAPALTNISSIEIFCDVSTFKAGWRVTTYGERRQ